MQIQNVASCILMGLGFSYWKPGGIVCAHEAQIRI